MMIQKYLAPANAAEPAVPYPIIYVGLSGVPPLRTRSKPKDTPEYYPKS